MRKFQVRANFRKPLAHGVHRARKFEDAVSVPSERRFEILADDVDDAKVRAKQLLKVEGYDEKSLQHATWTVSRLDRQREKKKNIGQS